jgi:uncharacterized protein DUF4384
MILRLAVCSTLTLAAFAQSHFAAESDKPGASQRMEIMLDRFESGSWHSIDPALVLEQADRIRFRFRSSFDGYLYVMNQSTSGKYEQLFPREETGQDNRIVAGKEYQIPATASVFRIAGPAGHEVVYWLITPARLSEGAPRYGAPPSGKSVAPPTLVPRCDDALLRARGECIDHSAGPKLVPRDVDLPQNLAGAADQSQSNLMFLRQKDTSVISSPTPLSGPVIYEFRLAHR